MTKDKISEALMKGIDSFLEEKKYPKAEKAVEEFWNDQQYNNDELWYIAFALIKRLVEE